MGGVVLDEGVVQEFAGADALLDLVVVGVHCSYSFQLPVRVRAAAFLAAWRSRSV